MSWLFAYAAVMMVIGLLVLFKPIAVRQRLMPEWRTTKGRFSWTSTLSFRLTGVGLLLIGLIVAVGAVFGTR